MKKISVVVAEKLPIVRLGFQELLTQENDMELLGETSDGKRAQELCQQNQPTVLLLDVQITGATAIETVAFLQEFCPQTQILIFTSDVDLCQLPDLLKMGVVGYLLKEETRENILEAIRCLGKGQTYFSQSIIKVLFCCNESSSPAERTNLTEMELKILSLMAQELTNVQIAKVLHISSRMLNHHTKPLYEKLAVHTKIGAVMKALKMGLLEL